MNDEGAQLWRESLGHRTVSLVLAIEIVALRVEAADKDMGRVVRGLADPLMGVLTELDLMQEPQHMPDSSFAIQEQLLGKVEEFLDPMGVLSD